MKIHCKKIVIRSNMCFYTIKFGERSLYLNDKGDFVEFIVGQLILDTDNEIVVVGDKDNLLEIYTYKGVEYEIDPRVK